MSKSLQSQLFWQKFYKIHNIDPRSALVGQADAFDGVRAGTGYEGQRAVRMVGSDDAAGQAAERSDVSVLAGYELKTRAESDFFVQNVEQQNG
jgi:hypothetical protein